MHMETLGTMKETVCTFILSCLSYDTKKNAYSDLSYSTFVSVTKMNT